MQWLSIEGYEGLYAVSDEGEVMSMNFAKSGLPGIMATRLRRGYASVGLRWRESKCKDFTVHALVASAFIGKRPKGLAINHKDGNKLNNRASNLEYVTYSENTRHAYGLGILKGRKGENHHLRKLNDASIVDIRNRLAAGEMQASIGALYGVDQSCISSIKHGKLWSHVPDERKVG